MKGFFARTLVMGVVCIGMGTPLTVRHIGVQTELVSNAKSKTV